MNEISTQVDWREKASELWTYIIDVGYVEDYQKKVDSNADKMIEEYLKQGQFELGDLFYSVIEDNDEHLRDACEYEVNHSGEYDTELKKCQSDDDYCELIDEVMQTYYESQPYNSMGFGSLPFRELCITDIAQYIIYRCYDNDNMLEINSMLSEEGGLVREDFNDTRIYISNSCNILFSEMENYENIFCKEVCDEFKELDVHLLLRGNEKQMIMLEG